MRHPMLRWLRPICRNENMPVHASPLACLDVSLPSECKLGPRFGYSLEINQSIRPSCRDPRCPQLACAVQRRRFPVGANPTRQPLQPEAIGAVMEVTKWLKPSISVSRIGDSASVQAATRVNAEQASKRTMRRSTRQPYRGRLIRLDEMSEAIRSDAAPG